MSFLISEIYYLVSKANISLMLNVYETLEFSKIQERILEFCKTEKGRDTLLSLKMSSDISEIKKSLNELDEMMNLIQRYGQLPISSSVSLLTLIDIAKKTAMMTPSDLNHVLNDIEQSDKLIAHYQKHGENFPLLGEYINSMKELSSLRSAIKRVITPSLTVSDNASPELKEIRHKIKTLEATLNSKVSSLAFNYSSYLNDNNVTIREGHFVLPVKTVYKNKVLGIIYDISDSGNTTFIEPLELVQLNNDIASKKIEENEEVRKILKELTSLVLLQEDEVIHNNNIIGYLDFVTAKANFALTNEMKIASISEKQEINLINAKHPLIDPSKVVGNDYYLTEEKRIVVISGPNAGGKTVSLKVVGLLSLMNQCGLALPVKEAKLGIFNHIYLDIGDNQSLSDNLSTFSSHMKNIAEILELAKGKDLVLLDELGTGTDPKEGEVIALTVVKELEARHSLAMISSHYSKIKEYAFISENIENSSMLFDEEKLLPTYIYKYQAPGKSYGLEVASRYGINKEAINKVKDQYFSENKNDIETLFFNLEKQIEENEKIKRENLLFKQNLEKEQKALEISQNNLKNQRENLLSSVKEEKEKILDEVNEQVEEIIKSLSGGNLKLHEAIELKKKVEQLKDEETQIIYDEEIQEGDYVSLTSLSINGKVTRINGKKAHILSSDGLSYDIEINKLHKVDAPKSNVVKNRNSNYETKINTNVGLELNIIGMRRDEAKEALEKYLDNCRIKNIKQVRIIHGFGSGILRKMVHEHLSTLKGVKYRLGDINEGGGGATVVILHD